MSLPYELVQIYINWAPFWTTSHPDMIQFQLRTSRNLLMTQLDRSPLIDFPHPRLSSFIHSPYIGKHTDHIWRTTGACWSTLDVNKGDDCPDVLVNRRAYQDAIADNGTNGEPTAAAKIDSEQGQCSSSRPLVDTGRLVWTMAISGGNFLSFLLP